MGEKIEDFGEKLEGARKDLAQLRKGLMQLNDDTIDRWSDAEREQYITKELAWKKPDYQKMLNDGIPKEVIYFIKQVRDAVPVRPAKKNEAWQRGYVNFVSEVRDTVMGIQSPSDFSEACSALMERFLEKSGYHSYKNSHDAWGSFTNKLFQALQKTPADIRMDVERKQFLYTDEEKNFAKHILIVASPQQFYKTAGKEAAIGSKPAVRLEMYSSQYSYQAITFTLPEGTDRNDMLDRLSTDCADCETGKWFVVTKDRRLLASGLDSKEEARKTAQDYANAVEAATTAAKQALEQQKQANTPNDNYSEKRKSKLLPPQLEHIQRTGAEHRQNDTNISGDDILAAFALRGGQFGNWTNQNDRQTSMNMAFDALRDLAVALDIAYTDIALKQSESQRTGSLGIAFGARGHSSALAHYEPLENVINLTKMKGAGSLAHEWGHALDSFVKRELHLDAGSMAQKSQKHMASHCCLHKQSQENPFKAVVEAMRWKDDGNGGKITTDYYKEARETDKNFSKTDNGYWTSNCEMFARAFACYVHDKLKEKGIQSDYLCGHSEFTVYPKGEERQAINNAIDGLIQDLKDKGLLHHQVHDIAAEMVKTPEVPVFRPHETAPETDFGEQMSLFDMLGEEPEPEAAAELLLPQKIPAAEPVCSPAPAGFDFRSAADAGLMLKEESVNENGESVIRAVLEEHTVENLSSEDVILLFERAGIQGDTDIAKLLCCDLTLCMDFYDNGDAEAVLRATSGIICAGEFPMPLSPEEREVFEASVQQELGGTLAEEHDRIHDTVIQSGRDLDLSE